MRSSVNGHLLIFDLDGTLIDSKQDLVSSVNAMRDWSGLPPIDAEVVASYVGNGAPMLVRRALPDFDDEHLERALRFFLDYYREHMLDATTLYPGVREALNALHEAEIPLAVLTNKPVKFSVRLLERLNLGAHFFRVYGGNSLAEKKPHPEGINLLVEESGAERSHTIMVGDSAVDVLTARNASVRACGVRWGFQPETFAQAPPDFLIEDMRELAAFVLENR